MMLIQTAAVMASGAPSVGTRDRPNLVSSSNVYSALEVIVQNRFRPQDGIKSGNPLLLAESVIAEKV